MRDPIKNEAVGMGWTSRRQGLIGQCPSCFILAAPITQSDASTARSVRMNGTRESLRPRGEPIATYGEAAACTAGGAGANIRLSEAARCISRRCKMRSAAFSASITVGAAV